MVHFASASTTGRQKTYTIRDSYLLLRMNKYFSSLGEATEFSTINVSFRCWRIEIDERYQYETACTSHDGLYRFVGMSSELKIVSKTFEGAIDVVLARLW